jgi:hypothetical protein
VVPTHKHNSPNSEGGPPHGLYEVVVLSQETVVLGHRARRRRAASSRGINGLAGWQGNCTVHSQAAPWPMATRLPQALHSETKLHARGFYL